MFYFDLLTSLICLSSQGKKWSSLIEEVRTRTRMTNAQSTIEDSSLRQSLLVTAYDAVWSLALSSHTRRGNHLHEDLSENIQALTFRGTAISELFME